MGPPAGDGPPGWPVGASHRETVAERGALRVFTPITRPVQLYLRHEIAEAPDVSDP